MPDAARYHRLRLLLALLGLALTVAYLGALLATGAGGALARRAATLTNLAAVRVLLVAAALALGHRALTLPVAWARGFWLPRRFGLLHQPLRAWLGDRAKAALLAGALGLLAVLVVYALLAATRLWWLAAAGAFFAGSVLLTAVAPVVVLPLFYRLTPLADAGLRERLLALARRAGVPAVGVFVADQSRRSRTANAAVVGLGRTRRIVLFDTLLARFTPDEIESVLAHELGHHVHGDVRRGLALQGALALVTFGLADVLLRAGVPRLGLAGPADPAGMPWLALVLLALGLAGLPLGNGVSRRLERQADDFALRATGNAAAFVGALERLGELNLAERRPPRLEEFVLYSHPALERRIARVRGGLA
ncbi:MAG: hypothetical protein A2W08_15200 [Candidatus Rokubacteria bacterium RBG_16_73_20]|nr:MAG: hypothetical protein A2W08_15200 [Candidatus Rokubacteria bacterium RBG_16_73_20]